MTSYDLLVTSCDIPMNQDGSGVPPLLGLVELHLGATRVTFPSRKGSIPRDGGY
jgi:hypothetical protein